MAGPGLLMIYLLFMGLADGRFSSLFLFFYSQILLLDDSLIIQFAAKPGVRVRFGLMKRGWGF